MRGGSDSATANTRVEYGVRDVDDHVYEHVGARDDQHTTLYERIVLLAGGGDDHAADPGQTEQQLDDDRAADQSPEADAGEGDQRERRWSQRLSRHDVARRH